MPRPFRMKGSQLSDTTTLISDELFLREVEPHIKAVCRSFRDQYRLGSAEIEDWSQELRIKALSIPQEKRTAKSWIRTVINNYARDLWRSYMVRERRVSYGEGEALAKVTRPPDVDAAHASHTVNKLLSALTATQRQIVQMHLGLAPDSDGGIRDFRRIGKAVGLSEQAAREEYAQARELMRDQFSLAVPEQELAAA